MSAPQCRSISERFFQLIQSKLWSELVTLLDDDAEYLSCESGTHVSGKENVLCQYIHHNALQPGHHVFEIDSVNSKIIRIQRLYNADESDSMRCIIVSPIKIHNLRGSLLSNSVITPSSPHYQSKSLLINQAHRSNPAVIIQCAAVSDVQKAIKFCNDFMEENPSAPGTVVRAGGHSFSGISTNSGGCVIDLRMMHSVVVDPAKCTAWVEGGALARHLDREAFVFGLVTPNGQVSSTGVGGLATGGGYGLLTHRYGLMIDNTLAVEMVLANSQVLQCSAEENPEVFWAARGGARWLGVVTKFKLQLHRLFTATSSALISWDIQRYREVFRLHRKLLEHEAFGFITIGSPPPLEGMQVVTLHLVVFSDLRKAREVYEFACSEIGERPTFELIPLDERPWPEINAEYDFMVPDGTHAYNRGIEKLDDEEKMLKFLDHFVKTRPPTASISIDWINGAFCNAPSEDGFFGTSRQPFYMCVLINPLDSENPEDSKKEAKDFCMTLIDSTKDSSKPIVYVNMNEHLPMHSRTSKAVHNRFARVKAEVDPDGFFGKC